MHQQPICFTRSQPKNILQQKAGNFLCLLESSSLENVGTACQNIHADCIGTEDWCAELAQDLVPFVCASLILFLFMSGQQRSKTNAL